MSERWSKRIRELLQGSDLAHAQRVERDGLRARQLEALDPVMLREQDLLAQDPTGTIRLGRLAEGPLEGRDFRIRPKDLLAHTYVLGQSGSGKSYFLLVALRALLEQRALSSLFVLDMKGELAELLTDFVLPGIAAQLPSAESDAFLNRIVVIDPFSATHPPPLNVLVRDVGLPVAIQARDVAECFEAATETDVTARMETILDWVLRLLIETRGSFVGVRRALQEPAVLEGLVREAKDPDVIRYFLTRYPSEPKASKLALLSRLDRFLALPMTQLALGAKYCLDFDTLLRDRIVILALGRAPAGLQSVARFFAMVVLTRFVRAIFRRGARAQGFSSLLVADEWQVALNGALAAEFESILTLARSRGVHLWLANQQLSQLDRYGGALRSVVLGQTALQAAFRLAPEDARALRHLYPVTGAMRRVAGPGAASGSPFLSASEEIEARVLSAARLPDRVGFWSDARAGKRTVVLRSATLALPTASSLPPSLVARTRRGAVALTVADLEAMRRAEHQRLDRLAAGPRARAPTGAAPVAPRAVAVASSTPAAPVVKPPRRRRRPSGAPPIR